MYFRLKTNYLDSFLLQESSYDYTAVSSKTRIVNPIRKLSAVGSDSYIRSLRRSFSRAKMLAFFNPDLTQFVTLTYAENMQDVNKALSDMKVFIKKNTRSTAKQLKYLYVFELQERGAIHVHMICNDVLETTLNKNGYLTVKNWAHGYSSLLKIDKLDSNFKPYLYLFKYMHKTQRVGKSFVHTSRNFDKIAVVDYDDYITKLWELGLAYREDFEFVLDSSTNRKGRIIKKYYRTPLYNSHSSKGPV